MVADLATNIPEASECLRTDAQLVVAKQRSKGLESFVVSTIHRSQFTTLSVTHLLTHSVLKFLSKIWRRFRREFSNFIRRCSRIFTSTDIYENQSWIVTSGIRSTAEIFCEYPKAEFISEKTPQFRSSFSRFTKLTHVTKSKLMLLSKICKWFTYEYVQAKRELFKGNTWFLVTVYWPLWRTKGLQQWWQFHRIRCLMFDSKTFLKTMYSSNCCSRKSFVLSFNQSHLLSSGTLL